MSLDQAKDLLRQAASEKRRLSRHLLVAAALREILGSEPIVVGGTAEEFWTRDDYHPTDLDVCCHLSREDVLAMLELGFKSEGRHYVHDDVPLIAVEFPDTSIDGDPSRVHREKASSGVATIIGLDDLYVDRLRQSTLDPDLRGVEFHSTLAVMAARFDDLDYDYIDVRIAKVEADERMIGSQMRRIHRIVQRRVRRALSE